MMVVVVIVIIAVVVAVVVVMVNPKLFLPFHVVPWNFFFLESNLPNYISLKLRSELIFIIPEKNNSLN